MRGVSRTSLAQGHERLASILARPGVDGAAVSEDLFSVADVFDEQISLRRALTDPSADEERKSALVTGLFGGKIGDPALEEVVQLASSRWSSGRDLSDATEELAVQAAVTLADQQGYLDDLEDDLFRFGRIVGSQPELRSFLGDPAIPGERKAELIGRLVEGKVRPVTVRLIDRAVIAPRGRSLDRALEDYAKIAADHRQRMIAVVRVAVDMTDAQRTRLADILRRMHGREVHLNIVLDPTVQGGISVQVGDEVIDGTITTRLDQARRQIAG